MKEALFEWVQVSFWKFILVPILHFFINGEETVLPAAFSWKKYVWLTHLTQKHVNAQKFIIIISDISQSP